jgi:group I intron endonuclease
MGNKNERKSMDNIINNSIIQKVTTKRLAIYKAIGMLPQPEFKDKFKKETLCQQNENTPKQSLEKCLNVIEPNKEKKVNDITNDTKIVNEPENLNTTIQIKSGIYKIINKIDGKYYVGSSKNIQYRWTEHKRQLNNNCHHNDFLQRTWNKYGSDSFDFIIVESTDIDKTLLTEQKYLDIAKTEQDKCYNLKFKVTGGDPGQDGRDKIRIKMTGRKLSSETKEKISKSKMHGTVKKDNKTKLKDRKLRHPNMHKEYYQKNRERISERKKMKRLELKRLKLNDTINLFHRNATGRQA